VALDFSTLRARIDKLDGRSAGNPRGRALEQIVCEMFGSLPGVEIGERNILAGSGEAELDILLANTQREDGLPVFGRDVLIECKSSDDPLDSRGVNHFVSQVQRRNLPWSVIVSLSGITGDRDDWTRAQLEIARAAETRNGIMVFTRDELREIRSVEHFAVVIEQKRRRQVAKMSAVMLNQDEIRGLDPRRGRIGFAHGVAAIERVIRETHDNCVNLILDAAAELPLLSSDDEVVRRAADRLEDLSRAVAEHRENPDHDPMWREVHAALVLVGAAFATLLEEDLRDGFARKSIAFDVRVTAPQKLGASVGGTLWNMLSAYRLQEVERGAGHVRRRNATALIAMVVDELISIDQIDPWDVYGDPEIGEA
jgi:hypothetical protein